MSVFRKILMSGIIDLPESQIFRYKADSKVTPSSQGPFNGKMVYHKYNSETGEGEIGNSEDIFTIVSDAFKGSNLKEAYLPSKCITIEDDAFSYTILNKIVLQENIKYFGKMYLKSDIHDSTVLEVHIPSLETWCEVEHAYWYQLKNDLYINDTKIVDLVIPGTINEIKPNTFSYCTSLESVTINEGVKKIGQENFINCPNLSNVSLNNDIEEVGPYVFTNCDKLPVYNNCVYADTILVSCLDNSSIDIKEGTKFIGSNALYVLNEWPVFEEITIPNSVIGIGRYAFNRCIINKVVIPDSVTYIDEGAFYHPKELEIGSGLKRVTASSFEKVTGLERIVVSDENKNLDSRNSCSAIIETNTGTLLLGSNNTIIPEGIKHIALGALSTCTLINDEIILPDGLITIGDHAFYNTNIYSVKIPNSTISIGYASFKSCAKLVSVTLGENIVSIGNEAFYGTSLINELICHFKNIPSIGTNCFYSVLHEKISLYYPENTDYNEFITNTNLKNLFEIQFHEDKLDYDLGDWDIALVVISNENNTTLFNNSSTEILNMQVDNVDLEDITQTYNFNDTKKEHIVKFKFKESKIPNSIFSNVNITSCKINDRITEIGTSAFSNCEFMNIDNLPTSLITINNYAFQKVRLKHFNCPNVEYIGDYAVAYSKNLKTIYTLDKTIEIGAGAFTSCSNLRKLVLGKNVTTVGGSAFKKCTSLRDVKFESELINFGDNVFSECKELPAYNNIYYADTYLVSIAYSLYTINIKEGTKYIGTEAFKNANATEVTLPDSVTHIYNYAFDNCRKITSITLGSNVEYVGAFAFQSCVALKTINCKTITAPTVLNYTFKNISNTAAGTLYYPKGSDYSSWLSSGEYYLGYYNWRSVQTEFE